MPFLCGRWDPSSTAWDCQRETPVPWRFCGKDDGKPLGGTGCPKLHR